MLQSLYFSKRTFLSYVYGTGIVSESGGIFLTCGSLGYLNFDIDLKACDVF
jgi:hypothetical protein